MHLLTTFHTDQRSLRELKVEKIKIFHHCEFVDYAENLKNNIPLGSFCMKLGKLPE
jgi:hypothetical protein